MGHKFIFIENLNLFISYSYHLSTASNCWLQWGGYQSPTQMMFHLSTDGWCWRKICRNLFRHLNESSSVAWRRGRVESIKSIYATFIIPSHSERLLLSARAYFFYRWHRWKRGGSLSSEENYLFASQTDAPPEKLIHTLHSFSARSGKSFETKHIVPTMALSSRKFSYSSPRNVKPNTPFNSFRATRKNT